MRSPNRAKSLARHKIRSISFDSADAAWIDALVELLRQAGYRRAARAEIIRTALQELRHVLAGRTREDIVRFFLDREAERVLLSVNDTLKLPFL